MKKMQTKSVLWILLILLLAIGFMYVSLGTYAMSLETIVKTIFGFGTKLDRLALFQIRLPRLILAWMVAIALAISGGMIQTLTRNSLADTNLLGFNAGAALSAVLFIQSQTATYYAELGDFAILLLPLITMFGASLTAFVLIGISGGKIIRPRRLILMGLGLQAGLNAMILLLSFRGGVGDYNRILVWLSGSLWGSGWLHVSVFALILVGTLWGVYRSRTTLDVLMLKDEHVTSLGVPIDRFRLRVFAYSVILAGSAVAFSGNIGFIGLLAPHMARRLVGPFHRKYLPVSALLGMILITLADAIAKNAFSPIELPVGLIIALIGVPYFIGLLVKEK